MSREPDQVAEIDDSLAANQEPESAREETGYQPAPAQAALPIDPTPPPPPRLPPALRKDGPKHWTVIEREGEAPPPEADLLAPRVTTEPDRDGNVRCASGHCRGHKPGAVMFAPPGQVTRSRESLTWCGLCIGDHHRRNVDRTRDCIQALKAAAAAKDDNRWVDQLHQLEALVGREQARQTADAIKAKAEAATPAKGGR